MVQIRTSYIGQKRCELTHIPSGSAVSTDAPKDNNGKGELFSPTDLVAGALASCMLTIMGIVTERDGVSLEGVNAIVTKEMVANPRRIGRLTVEIKMPKGLSADYRQKLENAAHTCPVKKSLHPDIDIPVTFTYPD